jgi:hypothetical protein
VYASEHTPPRSLGVAANARYDDSHATVGERATCALIHIGSGVSIALLDASKAGRVRVSSVSQIRVRAIKTPWSTSRLGQSQ